MKETFRQPGGGIVKSNFQAYIKERRVLLGVGVLKM